MPLTLLRLTELPCTLRNKSGQTRLPGPSRLSCKVNVLSVARVMITVAPRFSKRVRNLRETASVTVFFFHTTRDRTTISATMTGVDDDDFTGEGQCHNGRNSYRRGSGIGFRHWRIGHIGRRHRQIDYWNSALEGSVGRISGLIRLLTWRGLHRVASRIYRSRHG